MSNLICPFGKGKINYPNGDIYHGDIIRNSPSGYGHLTTNNATYCG